ncbi:MAG TPA: hypothetical protein DDW52_11315 [Planctomycetaceae bacterium]|nr:hypothetical protein [Planctomycetaceae bacterium]
MGSIVAALILPGRNEILPDHRSRSAPRDLASSSKLHGLADLHSLRQSAQRVNECLTASIRHGQFRTILTTGTVERSVAK